MHALLKHSVKCACAQPARGKPIVHARRCSDTPPCIALPSFIRARALAKLLRTNVKALLKSTCERHDREFYFENQKGVTYCFADAKSVIYDYAAASALALDRGFTARHVPLNGVLGDEQMAMLAAARGRQKKQAAMPSSSSQALSKIPAPMPVVVTLGHVDHGKTSIIAALSGTVQMSGVVDGDCVASAKSSTNMARSGRSRARAREVGGVTQRIGVWRVPLAGLQPELKSDDHDEGSSVFPWATFLDTPGHFAHWRMRQQAAGAAAGGAALLVVCASEGIRPQTMESIGCIEQLGLPVVVALNKLDLLLDSIDAEDKGNTRAATGVTAAAARGDADASAGTAVTARAVDTVCNAGVKSGGELELPPATSGTPPVPQRALERLQLLQRELLQFTALAEARFVVVAAAPETACNSTISSVCGDTGTGEHLEVLRRAIADACMPVTDDTHAAQGTGQQQNETTAGSSARLAAATVLDVSVERGRGQVLTVLVEHGVLSIGDVIVCGMVAGTVRSIRRPAPSPLPARAHDISGAHDSAYEDTDVRVASVGAVVELTVGVVHKQYNDAPLGKLLQVVPYRDDALAVLEQRTLALELRLAELPGSERCDVGKSPEEAAEIPVEEPQGPEAHGGLAIGASVQSKQQCIIVKARSAGALATILDAIEENAKLARGVCIVHIGVGPISVGDVEIAAAGDGCTIYGCEVGFDRRARGHATALGVEVCSIPVHHELVEELEGRVVDGG